MKLIIIVPVLVLSAGNKALLDPYIRNTGLQGTQSIFEKKKRFKVRHMVCKIRYNF